MSLLQRIQAHLASRPGLCDDCLTTELNISRRQTVNGVCSRNASIHGSKAGCVRCGKNKIVRSPASAVLMQETQRAEVVTARALMVRQSAPRKTHEAGSPLVSAWRDSSGFGLRLGCPLRDAWVEPKANSVELELPGGRILTITLTPAFWNKCPEFGHREIGDWLRSQGVMIPWPHGEPPKFEMERLNGRHFKVQAWKKGA
jgi:hypothetical protein